MLIGTSFDTLQGRAFHCTRHAAGVSYSTEASTSESDILDSGILAAQCNCLLVSMGPMTLNMWRPGGDGRWEMGEICYAYHVLHRSDSEPEWFSGIVIEPTAV